jgi:hypothetical protein
VGEGRGCAVSLKDLYRVANRIKLALLADADKRAGIDTRRCDKAPLGWYCTRKPGHDGPCAAWPYDTSLIPGRHVVTRGWTNTDTDPGPLLDEYGRTICLCPECHREHYKNGGAE